ncbi:MAG: hypothetical protein AB1938_32140 [Myxococcota bacterium]
MVRRVLLFLAVIQVWGAGCRASYAVNVRFPVDPTLGVNVAGTWKTNWGGPQGFNIAVVTMEQQGDRVTATYVTTGSPNGSFEGRLVGNELRGTWREADGRWGGLRFVFDSTGSRFEGTWGLGEHDDDGGVWDGNR